MLLIKDRTMMRVYDRWLYAVLLITLVSVSVSPAAETQVVSPDGAVRCKVSPEEPRLTFAVTFRGKPVIETSPLIMTLDGIEITAGARTGKIEEYQVDETYPTRGTHSHAVNRCNGVRIPFEHPGSKTGFTLDVRASNDGVAFRFVVPGDPALGFRTSQPDSRCPPAARSGRTASEATTRPSTRRWQSPRLRPAAGRRLP